MVLRMSVRVNRLFVHGFTSGNVLTYPTRKHLSPNRLYKTLGNELPPLQPKIYLF